MFNALSVSPGAGTSPHSHRPALPWAVKMRGMTAQGAFQGWLIYVGAIAAAVVTLAFFIGVFVVASSWSREREDR